MLRRVVTVLLSGFALLSPEHSLAFAPSSPAAPRSPYARSAHTRRGGYGHGGGGGGGGVYQRGCGVTVAATGTGLAGELVISEVEGKEDLSQATQLCVTAFFGQATSPWKSAQLRQLYDEQLADLTAKSRRPEDSRLFKATAPSGEFVAFAELSISTGLRSLGSSIPVADRRPVLANLAVQSSWRRRGVGGALRCVCAAFLR